MIWRLFKGRSSTTKEVTTSEDVQKQPEGPVVSNVGAPRMSAFRFESGRASPASAPQDTAVEAPAIEARGPDFATVVREKARRRRGIRAADRGVSPVLVPSLRETSVRLRAIAGHISDRKPNEAAHYWRNYLNLEPGDVDAWFTYGRCLLGAGFDDDATAAFQRVLDLNPDHSLAWAGLGYVAERSESPAQAAECYARAVEADRTNVDVLSQYARVLETLGDVQAAAAIQEQLEELTVASHRPRTP